jgi:hypothetical protein
VSVKEVLVLSFVLAAAAIALPDVRNLPPRPPVAPRVAPPTVRTPTYLLPPGGLPVTPECQGARARERWSGLPCGPVLEGKPARGGNS